jgi:FkbM family methyltransferase
MIDGNLQALADQLNAFRISIADARDRSALEFAAVKHRLHPPVLLGGNNVLVTEVDGFIVGLPGEEWRLAAYHAFRGVPDPGVAQRFQSLIRPGMVVVDVGANIGMYTLYAARLLASRGKVYSFEPAPRTFQILKDNVQVNGLLELGVVELRQVAVTDKAGAAHLAVFADDCGHNTLFFDGDNVQHVSVSTVTLDQALAGEKSIDIVKIDAEGSEPLILRGMRQILDHNPRIRILLEFAPIHLRRAGIDPRQFLADLSSMGFGVRRIHDESGELMETLIPELMVAFSVNLELARDLPRLEEVE